MDEASLRWLTYFRANRHRAPLPSPPPLVLEPRLRAPLVRALQCFQLGEAGEGRLAAEAMRITDPALDPAVRESMVLYVAEEGRHAREVAHLLAALGARTLTAATSERLFRAGRRLLGLRTKMLTIAAAEVVGVVFYELLASIRDPHMSALGRKIAAEEAAHLEFQRFFFRRATRGSWSRRALVRLAFAAILGAAMATVWLHHGALFRARGFSFRDFLARCFEVARGPTGQSPMGSNGCSRAVAFTGLARETEREALASPAR